MIKGWMAKDYPVGTGKMFEVPAFEDWMSLAFSFLHDDADAYIMTNDRNIVEIISAAEKCGFKHHNLLIWQKPNGIPNRWYFKDCEFTFYGFKGKAETIRTPSSTQVFKAKHAQNKQHMSQKPVELFLHYVENSSDPNQCVFEPFSGSGTTILACEQSGRVCYAMELKPEYVDVAVKRWQDFTGKAATLEGDGRTFSEISEASAK
jgi:site-specific DNA-methyltransferase (adenine-specific)